MMRLSSAACAFIAFASVTAAACGAGPALPTATATLGWARVSLPRGSYCWQGGGTGTCADSPGADTLLRSGYLKPFTIASGVTARVTFSTNPRQVEVTLLTGPAVR